MPQPLRDYQDRALSAVFTEFGKVQSVCLVAPTGAGKTVMGANAVARAACRTIWITHRDELIDQSAAALERCGLTVGVFAADRMERIEAPVLVASWQTLLTRDDAPPVDFAVIDECHHAGADEWGAVVDRYPRRLGLTATPQRGDGRPLDRFQALVVAAQYSELIKAGHLVACRVFRPDEDISPNIAKHPLEAYQERANGKKAIVFGRTVEACTEYAAEFVAAGIPAAVISDRTKGADRARLIEAFKAGDLRVLVNVFVLTEGFDCPDCDVCIIARGCTHTGTYLQMVGRVLRPAPGKETAMLIDLSGVSHSHGLPTEDRFYSLDGKKPISSSGTLRVCPACGGCYAPEGSRECPFCGHVGEAIAPVVGPKIYDMALAEVFAGADTPDSYKRREWDRLAALCQQKKWSISWAAKQYKTLFGANPDPGWFTDAQKFSAFESFKKQGAERGYKPGFAGVRYKELFGKWPPREWR